MKKTIIIEGMSCKHCSSKVEENLNAIDGVKAKVDLKKGLATVKAKAEIDNSVLTNAIEKDGYKVKSIE